MIAANPSAERGARLATGSAREYLHDSRHGIRSVENAGRPAHDLDAIDIIGGQVAEIEVPAGGVHWHAIDKHFGVAALAPPQEEGCERAGSSALLMCRERHFMQCVGHERHEARSMVVEW